MMPMPPKPFSSAGCCATMDFGDLCQFCGYPTPSIRRILGLPRSQTSQTLGSPPFNSS
jgi:hypothetical protein